MQHSLAVNINGQASRITALKPQLLRIGSDPRCEIHIAHPEVADQAATLDCSSGGYLICNLNPYDIYLGSRVLEPQQWSDWSPSEQLHLTRNITLALQSGQGPTAVSKAAVGKSGSGETPFAASNTTAVATEEQSAEGSKKLQQILVIGVCALLGIWMLFQDNSREPIEPGSAEQFFMELQEKSNSLTKSDPDSKVYEEITSLLKAAHLSEKSGPDIVAKRYGTLLRHDRIQKAEPNGSEHLFYQIKIYAGKRIEAQKAR